MKKFSFIIDVAMCENCNNCFLSCKDEHCGNEWPGYSASQPLHGQRWMNIARKERGTFPEIDVAYLPKPCMHCDDAPCIEAAQDNAVYKREDGIVVIDPLKARGQKKLVKSCPFGAIWWNEEVQLPQKCTFCAHLLDKGWKQPRCVQSCPTGALAFLHVEDDELETIVQKENLECFGTSSSSARPRCFYKNLHRYTKCFIAGSVASGNEGESECVEGAIVKLLQGGVLLSEQKSDDFGDFKFDRLPPKSGNYSIEIETTEGVKRAVNIQLEESVSVGTLWV